MRKYAVVIISLVALVCTSIPFPVAAETEAEMRAALEKELAAYEELIKQQQALLQGKQSERQSLERDL